MSSIRKKIRLALSGRKPEIEETIRFSEVKSYIEKLRDSEKVSKDYSSLMKSYDEFMEKLGEVKKELEILQKNGEKRFTRIAIRNLEGIKDLDEFNSSSFREFYVDTAQVVHDIMKIPGGIQRKTLNYEHGKETIDALNSFLRSFKNLRKVFSEILAENSVTEYHGNALKKYIEIEDSLRKREDLQNRIKSLRKEKEEKKRDSEEKTANLRAAQSRIDNKEILEVKKRIVSLDKKIKQSSSGLRINLRKGRRPISKILHSEDKKLFEFYQYFTEHPLENINERFWEIIATLEKERSNLGEKERKKIDGFLDFCKKKLNDMMREYEEAEARKRELEENFSKVSLENKEFLRDFELQEETARKDLAWTSKELDEMERESSILGIDIGKNVRILEKMLGKIGNNRVTIEFD